MEGTWFSPDQLGRMQTEFGLSPLATEMIGQAPQLLQALMGQGGGGGMGGGLMGLLGGGGKGKQQGKGGGLKDQILAMILQNMQQPPPPTPMDMGGGFGLGY